MTSLGLNKEETKSKIRNLRDDLEERKRWLSNDEVLSSHLPAFFFTQASIHYEIAILETSLGKIKEARNDFAKSSKYRIKSVKSARRLEDKTVAQIASEPDDLIFAIQTAYLSCDKDALVRATKHIENMNSLEKLLKSLGDQQTYKDVELKYHEAKFVCSLVDGDIDGEAVLKMKKSLSKIESDYHHSRVQLYNSLSANNSQEFEKKLDSFLTEYQSWITSSEPSNLFCIQAIFLLKIAEKKGIDISKLDFADTNLCLPASIL